MLLLLLPIGAGCSSVFGADEERFPGVILYGSDEPVAVIPDSVGLGDAFLISVETAWPNGCARKGDTEVESAPGRIVVTPYDIVVRGEGCTGLVQTFTHTAFVRLTQTGEARVVVRGRAAPDVFDLVGFEYPVVVK
jgi:hypothetical protein